MQTKDFEEAKVLKEKTDTEGWFFVKLFYYHFAFPRWSFDKFWVHHLYCCCFQTKNNLPWKKICQR